MGKIVHKGPANVKEYLNGALLEAGKEVVMPFKDIPKHILASNNYEVYDDEGNLVANTIETKIEESEKEVPRMGDARIGSGSKKKKKSKKKKD